MDVERRQHERQKLYSPEYFDMGAENGGMIVDVSEDGLGFQAVGRVEKGSEIAVSFSLGAGYRISARARIAWVGSNGNSGGTTFTRLPADSRSIIREWVTKTAEATAAREAASAVDAEITAPESEESRLIIERVETPRTPLPVPTAPMELATETPVGQSPVEPPAQEAIQPKIPSVEPLTAQPDISPTATPQTAILQDSMQDVQTDLAAAAESVVPSAILSVAPPIAESVAESVIEETNQQNLELLVSQDAQHDATPTIHDHVQRDVQASVESVSHPDIQPNLRPERDAPFSRQPEAHEESAASSADTSRAHISAGDASTANSLPPADPLSSGIPPEIPASIAPKLSAQAPDDRPRATQTPAAPPRTEPPRPLFPPRNTGELFSRSPWISGQSLPEEERSHKGLTVVIVILLIVAASAASVPYIRAHRQEIGARIESMGRSVAGEPAQNASALSQQSSQQSPPQPPQQTSQLRRPSPQTAALPSSTPSSSGGAIPNNPSSAPATSPQVPAPSASTATPSPQLHLSAPATNAGSGAAAQNPPVASPLSAISPATGSTSLLAVAGQTEFQQAQKYLNGTGGVAADPAEAAELFWRSLEKGNTAAAIPLADLYLQGKGVSRSCLQARILLTTAANKGNAEASQKLGQLPENCE